MPHLSSELRGPYSHGFRCGERTERVKRLKNPEEHGWYSISLNSSSVGKIFSEFNSEGLFQSSGKGNERCCLAFMSSTKREFGHFHAVVVQRRQRNVAIAFLPLSLPSPSPMPKFPKDLATDPLYGSFARRGLKLRPATCKDAALIRNLTAFEHFLIFDFSSDFYRIFWLSNFFATLHVARTMWASSLKDFSVSTGNHNPVQSSFFFPQNVR